MWDNNLLLLFLSDISHMWITWSLIISILSLFGWMYISFTSSSSKVFSFSLRSDFLRILLLSSSQCCWYSLYLWSCLVYFVSKLVWSFDILERIVLRWIVLFITWLFDIFWFLFERLYCLLASANKSDDMDYLMDECFLGCSCYKGYRYFYLNSWVPTKSKLFPRNLWRVGIGSVDRSEANILV